MSKSIAFFAGLAAGIALSASVAMTASVPGTTSPANADVIDLSTVTGVDVSADSITLYTSTGDAYVVGP